MVKELTEEDKKMLKRLEGWLATPEAIESLNAAFDRAEEFCKELAEEPSPNPLFKKTDNTRRSRVSF